MPGFDPNTFPTQPVIDPSLTAMPPRLLDDFGRKNNILDTMNVEYADVREWRDLPHRRFLVSSIALSPRVIQSST